MEGTDSVMLAIKKEVEDPLPSTCDPVHCDVAIKEEIFEENSNCELIHVKQENEMVMLDDDINSLTVKEEDVDLFSLKPVLGISRRGRGRKPKRGQVFHSEHERKTNKCIKQAIRRFINKMQLKFATIEAIAPTGHYLKLSPEGLDKVAHLRSS